MPSDRAASLGDIAIGVFILGVAFLSSALNRGSRSAPPLNSLVPMCQLFFQMMSVDCYRYPRISFCRVLGHFRAKLRSMTDPYTGNLLCS